VAKWAFIGVLPQLVVWPAFTIVAGFVTGTIATAIARRGKPAIQTAG
jgi:hypothetical protein